MKILGKTHKFTTKTIRRRSRVDLWKRKTWWTHEPGIERKLCMHRDMLWQGRTQNKAENSCMHPFVHQADMKPLMHSLVNSFIRIQENSKQKSVAERTHDTVVIFATAGASKGAKARCCRYFCNFCHPKGRRIAKPLRFRRLQALQTERKHDTVVIFAVSGAKKNAKTWYCRVFLDFRCFKQSESTILLSFL